MNQQSLRAVVRHLRKFAARPAGVEPSDQELLGRFVNQDDEAAFDVLVHRHGPMVRDLCWRRLGQQADVDDASQAVFLVLARKAQSIRKQSSLASWLYGVAYRVAERAKRDAARRRKHEQRPPPERTAADPAKEAAWRDLCATLDAELSNLSDTYRAPLVLCYLEGRTRDQAAQQLGLTVRTLDRRLERGRELLRSRLARRGLMLSSALLVTGLSRATGACLPGALQLLAAGARARSAGGGASGIPARVQALAEGVLHGMTASKLQAVAAAVLGLTMAAAGAGLLGLVTGSEDDPTRHSPRTTHQAVQAKPPRAEQARTDRYGDPLPPAALSRLGTLRFRHAGEAWAVAFSPDGKILASACWNGVIYLWDAASGKEIRRLRIEGESGNYTTSSMDFFPDGRTLFATDARGTVRIWDVASGKKLLGFTGFNPGLLGGETFPTRLSPDGKVLAVAGMEFNPNQKIQSKVNLLDAATGRPLRTFEVTRGVPIICFSPDGKLLATLSPNVVQLWDVATGKLRREFKGHPYGFALAFSPDGRTIVSGNKDQIVLSEAATGMEIGKLEATMDCVMSLAFTPDGKALISANNDGKVRIWDLASRKERFTLDARMWMIRSMGVAKDGKTIAVGTVYGTIRLWDVDTGKERFPEYRGHDASINSVAYSPDGKILATGGDNQQLCLWEAATAKLLKRINFSARSLAFSSDGKRLVSAWPHSKAIRLWDVATGKLSRELKHGGLGAKCAAFSPDGTRLVSAHADLWHSLVRPCSLRLWDLSTGKSVHEFSMQSASLECLAFSADGKTVAVGSGNGTIYLWDASAGRPIRTLLGHGHSVGSVAFSPNGRTLVSGSNDQTLRLWNVSTGKEMLVFRGHERAVMAVAFSPAGRLIASAGGTVHHPTKTSGPEKIRIWEVASGKEILRLEGHNSNVNSLAFHPQGRQLVSGMVNGTALVWNLVPQPGK